MKKFKATKKPNILSQSKHLVKRLVQPGRLSRKDKGKLVYFEALKEPVLENYVFYEAFAGLGILDHPRAIFKALLEDSTFQDFTHVWSIDNLELASFNTEEFSSLDNVIIVLKGSNEYYEYLATCKYLIANTTFGYFFEKRNDQIYINTWHGVPTKVMGYEHAVERVENARGPARHFLSADYLLSSNRFMTNIMYRRAYKMDGLFEGKLLEIGSPRCDTLVYPDKEAVLEKLEALGIETDKKIILYAPTWKGNLYDQLNYNVAEFKELVQKFAGSINRKDYRIYLRVHYFLYRILAEDPELQDMLIPFTIDTNELLSVVDVLISDYSSIFFDYLLMDKPIIFYVPDLEQYESGRGLYVPVDSLPGLVTSNKREACAALTKITISDGPAAYMKPYVSKLEAMKSWCTYNEDGHACMRLIHIVFGDALDPGNDVTLREDLSEIHLEQYSRPEKSFYGFDGFDTGKKRLLLCFNTRVNSPEHYDELEDYLSEIDYSETDVTLLVTSFKDEFNKQFFNNLPEEVRILVWYALPFVTPETQKFYRQEIRRTLGNVHFDEVEFIGEITKYWASFGNAVLDL
ncbi:MAG: CDP-glycerol glycerophosphotransferase family protein [Eubacterium sp.]|nr:CDP-glycerol glycerophosphotransferase family protein [Eubacterium sp.]